MATRNKKQETGIIVAFGLGIIAGMAMLGIHVKNSLRKSAAAKAAVDQTISEEQ